MTDADISLGSRPVEITPASGRLSRKLGLTVVAECVDVG